MVDKLLFSRPFGCLGKFVKFLLSRSNADDHRSSLKRYRTELGDLLAVRVNDSSLDDPFAGNI